MYLQTFFEALAANVTRRPRIEALRRLCKHVKVSNRKEWYFFNEIAYEVTAIAARSSLGIERLKSLSYCPLAIIGHAPSPALVSIRADKVSSLENVER